jgi:hypothetical protein
MEPLVAWCREELARKTEILKWLGTGDMRISESRGGVMQDTTEERKLALDRDIKALAALIEKYGD